MDSLEAEALALLVAKGWAAQVLAAKVVEDSSVEVVEGASLEALELHLRIHPKLVFF